MNKQKTETVAKKLRRLANASLTLTDEHVEACAWAMGCYNCGWTPETLHMSLDTQATSAELGEAWANNHNKNS